MQQQPIAPIDQFLKPMLDAWVRCGIRISFNRVEKNILYLNIDKKVCIGCKGNAIRSRVMRSIRQHYPNIITLQFVGV